MVHFKVKNYEKRGMSMKPAYRVLSLLLALCMILSVVPFGALAEGEEQVCQTCQQTESACTCEKTRTPACLGESTCANGHVEQCPLYVACTAQENCPGTVHTAPCQKACQQYEGCAGGTHSSDCCLFVCNMCQTMGGSHSDSCPSRCQLLEGCKDGAHDEQCVLYLCQTCAQKPCVCQSTDPVTQKQLTAIALAVQPKTSYAFGEDLDVTGGKLNLIYSDHSGEEIDLTSQMVTGFDPQAAGQQTLTVTYETLITTYTVTVAQRLPDTSTPPDSSNDMFLYMDALDGNGVWTSWDDVVGMDFSAQLKYGNPENNQITNVVTMDELLISESVPGVVGKAAASQGMVHYSLQKVGYADLSLSGSDSVFRINVHKFFYDQLVAVAPDGTIHEYLFEQPGTYNLSMGVTNWEKAGTAWTPDDDKVIPVSAANITVSGTGVTLTDSTITIAQGASATLTYTVNGEEKGFFVGDATAPAVQMTRYYGDRSSGILVGATLRSPMDNGPVRLRIARGNAEIAYENLSISDTEVANLEPITSSEVPYRVMLAPNKPGTVKLYYTPDLDKPTEKQLLLTVEFTEPTGGPGGNPGGGPGQMQVPVGSLIANMNGSYVNMVHLEPNVPLTTILYAAMPDGQLQELDPATIYATSDLIWIQRVSADSKQVKITVNNGANGYIRYLPGSVSGLTQDQWFPLQARSYGVDGEVGMDTNPNLLICDQNGGNPRASVLLGKGESMKVTFRYGSVGASIPVTQLMGDNSKLKLISLVSEGNGVYTITAGDKKTGTEEIVHQDAENGNGAKVQVIEKRAENKMLFQSPAAMWNNDILPYLDMTAGQTVNRKLYFGDKSGRVEVTENLTASGNVSVKKNASGGYDITAGEPGTGLLEYTKDGVVYTMSVWIEASGTPGGTSNYEARNAIKIGNTIFATAQLEPERLIVQSNFGGDYEVGVTTAGFSRQVVLAAMAGNGEVDKTAYSKISDVSMQLLTCVDENDDVTPNNNARISATVTPVVPQADGATTHGAVVQADAQKGFHSILAISFTLQDGNTMRRCTVCAYVSYVSKAGNVVIYANDLTDTGKLNVVLSSYEAFYNWLTDSVRGNTGAKVNGTFELGGNITMILPAVSYDGIVVAQMISDIVTNSDKTPISHMALEGNNSGSTTMDGMLYKGGISRIRDIDFVADSSKTLSYGDTAFTCGILADYGYTTNNSFAWDTAYAQKYCTSGAPTTMANALAASKTKLENTYNADLRWGNVEIYDMDNCTFTGYDYGVRSTARGLVGSGYGNRFTDCFYGIYVDSYGMGVSRGNPHHTDYNNCVFQNNAFAFRLASRPADTTAYDVRVHDSVFVHNLREFWISPEGNYYFYRNYYGGYWKENSNVHWKEFLGCNTNQYMKQYMDKHDEDKTEDHRPGRYYDDGSNGKARVITAAGKIVNGNGNNSSKTEGYWIYAREDQINWILQGEDLPINHQAIQQLQTDTEVTVVDTDAQGNTTVTAVITFQGKGGNAA